MENIIKNLADLYRENPVKALAELYLAYNKNQYNIVKAREESRDRTDLLKEQKQINEGLDFVKSTFTDKDLKSAIENAKRLSDEKYKAYKVEKVLSPFPYTK